jgi:hypothetical protein
MPLASFEPAIPASDRLQTHALDRTVAGIGKLLIITSAKNCGRLNVQIFYLTVEEQQHQRRSLTHEIRWFRPKSSWTASSLEMRPTGCPETSVTKYQPTPTKIPSQKGEGLNLSAS